ncbi:LysE family translocator [Cupriavidus metallidurans]|jgi:threonine/homoserine/homoserine lactone efflux protein|uniref:LysE family translocator n=1 Tax=Cupriavidus metallidurans TaxID=119219 RepID=UPI0007636D67|nr:LysE family translocator [Cupriavidus metallidurans]KWW34563.1 Cysteine/O-acetylserine efflux protein [Cupriavidus metallidurans]UBM10550.1 LysE family translocator [Cupriavidus metallidurans]
MTFPAFLPNVAAGSGVLLAFCAFALVSSITPGPNNTMVLASGVNFGIARTVPHLLGISIGFSVMVALVGLGLGSIFTAWPWMWDLLRVVATAYLVWLAWKLATAGGVQDREVARPMSFLRAAAFQWVNPKAWVMAVGACSTYVLDTNIWVNAMAMACLFAVINLPSVATWAVFGAALRSLLARPRVLRVFNVTMALMLLASLLPILGAHPHG